MKLMTRRDSLASLGAMSGVLATPFAASAGAATPKTLADARVAPASLPIHDPLFNVKTLGRLQGDLSGRTVYAFKQGRVFGLNPGSGPSIAEYGRLMYLVEGLSVRSSSLRNDGAIVERNRNWLFYKDAESGRYISTYSNPYTGEQVPVPTFRAGITGAAIGPRGPEFVADFPMESTVFDQPMLLDWQFMGDQAWIYRHAFTRWREASSGQHRTEMTLDCWVCRIADIANESLQHIPNTYSWVSQTEWQSWLKMGDRPGAMLWRTDGVLFNSIDQLPRGFVEKSEKELPGQLAAPL